VTSSAWLLAAVSGVDKIRPRVRIDNGEYLKRFLVACTAAPPSRGCLTGSGP
jgi:hypothetical protein